VRAKERAMAMARDLHLVALSQQIDNMKPDVMPGLSVLCARISQSDQAIHDRLRTAMDE
jgi:hypothetical protein